MDLQNPTLWAHLRSILRNTDLKYIESTVAL